MQSINQKGWLIGARSCPSPNFNARPPHTIVNLLVIHAISLPPDQFGSGDVVRFFQNTLDFSSHPYYQTVIREMKVSAHFFIDRMGEIYQFVSTEDRAWHAGVSSFEGVENCNDYSIGIEMEGSDTISFMEPQYASLNALTPKIQARYPAITGGRIVSHAEIARPQGRKADPGPCFDWTKIKVTL